MDYFDWYAAYLHRACPVVDAHLDLVTEVYRRRLAGEKGILKKYYKDEFQKSGVNLVLASLFLGEDELRDSREGCAFPKGAVLKKSMEMLAAFYEDMEEAKGRIQLVTDRESLRRITAKRSLSRHHKVGVLLYLEGLDMLEGEPGLLRCFYAMGVRGAALTWNRREPVNVFAQGCFVGGELSAECGSACRKFSAEESKGGKKKEAADVICHAEAAGMQALTDKGVQALYLMEKLGIFIDSSHLSRQAAWLLPSFTKKPYAATHSNAAALCDHPRNLTDGEIGEIAKRGGVIGVNACRDFVGRQEGCGVDALCGQIIYLMKTAGEDKVGLGLDLGEESILAGYGELQKVTADLLRRGCPADSVKKVLGGNWIRFLTEILK